ncbi:MAG TPA: hypothetical protein VLH12_04730 [Usitatibacter sp.]|nr:hypothetical protein [Usitatibacter sp.]
MRRPDFRLDLDADERVVREQDRAGEAAVANEQVAAESTKSTGSDFGREPRNAARSSTSAGW